MSGGAYDEADHFLIPLLDGRHGLGQVLSPRITLPIGAEAPLCILTSRIVTADAPLHPVTMPEVLSVELVDPAPLADRTWPVIGFEQLPEIAEWTEVRRLADRDADGPLLRDTGLIEAFVNACHGLYPWDGFGSPSIFDALLRPGAVRPG